ncbi:hypothetical protein AURDEDRAFT_131955 [Auricularia subglabra TFB-10046 SS5]|uniref:Uncharacterized protein n=1 Tax=Auricularia subglabra (strain TFB-10046 / SS5) TaxID=717982 RepID=J0WKQ0_AURST|nr:hypothetical protein AURDEDRAFT_131955 [Auricularia subglabra TFB-10046 SS5]
MSRTSAEHDAAVVPVEFMNLSDQRFVYNDAVIVHGYLEPGGLPKAVSNAAAAEGRKVGLEVFGGSNEAAIAAGPKWSPLPLDAADAKVYVGAAPFVRIRVTAVPNSVCLTPPPPATRVIFSPAALCAPTLNHRIRRLRQKRPQWYTQKMNGLATYNNEPSLRETAAEKLRNRMKLVGIPVIVKLTDIDDEVRWVPDCFLEFSCISLCGLPDEIYRKAATYRIEVLGCSILNMNAKPKWRVLNPSTMNENSEEQVTFYVGNTSDVFLRYSPLA